MKAKEFLLDKLKGFENHEDYKPENIEAISAFMEAYVNDPERSTDQNCLAVSRFIEHCKSNGHPVPEDLYLSFFNA